MSIHALENLQLPVKINTFSCRTSSTQNNSSLFTTPRELFKVFTFPPKSGMRERKLKRDGSWMDWEWTSSVSLHIEVVFSISGFKGLRKRTDRDPVCWAQELRGGDMEELTQLIYLWQLNPHLLSNIFPLVLTFLLHLVTDAALYFSLTEVF